MASSKIIDSPAPIGMFAVMRHRQGMKNAKFSVARPTLESAVDEAKRLSQVVIAEQGADVRPFCFYVVEIVGRVGIINGALQSSH